MDNRSVRLAPLGALVLLSSACLMLDDDTDAEGGCLQGGATPEATLGPEQVAIAGTALRMFVTRVAWGYEPVTAGWTSSGCVTVGGMDADLDGYPDASGTVTLDSCARPAYGGTVIANGSFSLTDGSPSASFAHLGSGTIDWTQPGSLRGDLALSLQGFQGADFATSNPSFTLVTDPGPGTTDELRREEAQVVATYEADDATWQGGMLESGLLDLYGAWEVEMIATLKTFDLFSGSGTPMLVVDPACPERITGGSVSARYAIPTGTFSGDCDGGEIYDDYRLTVTWAGCGTTSVTHQYAGQSEGP